MKAVDTSTSNIIPSSSSAVIAVSATQPLSSSPSASSASKTTIISSASASEGHQAVSTANDASTPSTSRFYLIKKLYLKHMTF